MSVVIDASMALAWLFEREKTEEILWANGCLQYLATANADAVVPSLWYTEVANGMLVGERRKLVTPAKASLFRANLANLPIRCDDSDVALRVDSALGLARAHQLSVYDATYLELAMRLGATLASFDIALIVAAKSVGVSVDHLV